MAAAQEILIAPGKSSFLIACSIQKPGNYGEIFRVKARLRKYLKENCSSELYLQLSFIFIFHSKFILISMTGPDNNGQVDLQA